MSLGVALLAFLNVFGVKLGVLFLAGLLAWRIGRRAHGAAPDAGRYRLLAWSLFVFALSEVACSLEEYVLRAPTVPLACAHALTSGVALALAAVGLFDVLDGSFVHFVDRGGACVAARLCGVCTQRASGRCRFRGTLALAAVLVAFLAVPVLFAPVARVVTRPADWVVPFPAAERAFAALVRGAPDAPLPALAPFYLPAESLWIEFRLLPWAALALALLGLAALARGREGPGVRWTLAALGTLFFVYSDVVAYALRRDAYLGGLLHECEELLLLLLLASYWARAEARPAAATPRAAPR